MGESRGVSAGATTSATTGATAGVTTASTRTETTGDTRVIPEAPAPTTDDGDHDRFAHYVAKDKIVESVVTGVPVIALCGKVWVPSRDPSRYPLCPECKRLYELGPEGRMREWSERLSAEG